MVTVVDTNKLFRQFIGLDSLVNENVQNYPPHNIEKINDDQYVLTLAVAGFSPDNIKTYVQSGYLFIDGEIEQASSDTVYIHRGLSLKNFKRKFILGENMEVKTISLENGLLQIFLERIVPEQDKPKVIPITVRS